MLNRTNRTLSANLNGLNLGTRSLALTGVKYGKTIAQHLRHAHDSADSRMRAGMPGMAEPSFRRPSRLGFIPVSHSELAPERPLAGGRRCTGGRRRRRRTGRFRRVRLFTTGPDQAATLETKGLRQDRGAIPRRVRRGGRSGPGRGACPSDRGPVDDRRRRDPRGRCGGVSADRPAHTR